MRIRKLKDGTPLNSNFKLSPRKDSHLTPYNNHGTYKGLVIKKTHKEDENNRYKKSTTYDVMIVGGPRDGETVTSAVPHCGFGGTDNYLETTYKPASKKPDKDSPPHESDGSYVTLTFLDGHFGKPLITGGWPRSKDFGISESDDVAVKGHFNGLDISINKDGTINLKYGSTEINMDGKEGNLDIKTSKDANITSTGKTTIDSTGNVEIASAGSIQASGAAGIGFTGPFVNLGSNGATEQAVLGNLLKSWLDSHVHPSDNTPPTTPVPTSVLSSKVKVE